MTVVQPGPNFITQNDLRINKLNTGERSISQYNGSEEISDVDEFDSTRIADLSVDVYVLPPGRQCPVYVYVVDGNANAAVRGDRGALAQSLTHRFISIEKGRVCGELDQSQVSHRKLVGRLGGAPCAVWRGALNLDVQVVLVDVLGMQSEIECARSDVVQNPPMML